VGIKLHDKEEKIKHSRKMKKGSKMTEEQRKKVSEAQKRRFTNPEERKKIGESSKGRIPWNKGTKGLVKSWNKGRKGLQVAWNKGKTGIYSEETRRKIGLASKGRKLSEEHKRKISNSLIGRRVSQETKRKISIANKGKSSWSKGIKTGKIAWNRGKPRSEETIKKIREATIGKKRSEETKRKISLVKKGTRAWNKGKKMPEMSGERHPMFGKTHSEKSKFQMSESHKKRMSNPEFRKRLSKIHKQRLANPEEMKRQVEVSRRTILRLYESGAFPKQTNTKIERDIKEELVKRNYIEGVDFIHQFKFNNKFMCDFCFPKQKIIIEAYGDFWHANPKKYSGKKLHPHQIKGINRDKSKEAYIKKVDNNSWTYLYFWESDIKENLTKCIDKIEEILIKKKI